MNTLTPSRTRAQQKVPTDHHNSTNDYSSPARGKAPTTPPLYTTVDNLLLPGVIGATVEGPKTPIRSPNARRVIDFFPHANNSSDSKRNKMAFPSSPFAVAQQSRRVSGNYIDTEIALDRLSPLGYNHNARNGDHFQTPRGKQYRKAHRPHDTPIATSKQTQNNNNYDNVRDNPSNGGNNGKGSDGPASYLYRPSPFVDERGHINDYDDDEDKENQLRSANFRSHQETDRSPSDRFERTIDDHHQSREREEDPRDRFERNDAYEENDADEGLDIGEQEDEIYSQERLHGNNYQDATMDGEESLDEQTELEVAELKREQEQLGFIKRWAHLLRKQRDEFGWGGSKQQDEYPSEGSDVDSDSSLTSARVRREPYRRKAPTASRLSRVISAPAVVSKSPSPQPRSPTPQQRSPTPPQRSPTPQQRSPTPQARVPRSRSASPGSPSRSPFTIPSMRQFDSGIGLDGSQASHEEVELLEELAEEEEEGTEELDNVDEADEAEEEDGQLEQGSYQPLERHRTPSPRLPSHSHTFEGEDEHPYITERFDRHPDTSDYESDREHRSAYGRSSWSRYTDEPRYNWNQETAPPTPHRPADAKTLARVYPWHVIGRAVEGYSDTVQRACHSLVTALEHYAWAVFSWVSFIVLWPWTQRHIVRKTVEPWIRAGVASGLLRPGTLTGVALLGLAVWGSHKLGYEDVSGIKGDRACNNETVVQSPSRGPLLKEIVSSTWGKFAWPGTSDSDGHTHDTNTRRWFEWVPSIPPVDQWAPFRKDRKQPPTSSGMIQIPAEQIHSLEDLETRIEWIQKALVDLGQADDRLGKELHSMHSELEGMSIWVSGVEHKLNKVSDDVVSLKKYVSDGRWIEQTVLELVRDKIPRHLVVAKDPRTGKLSIPSEFWDTARELFMTSEQVQKSIQDQVALINQDKDERQDDESSSGRWSWGSSRGKKRAGKTIGWDDFLLENEKAMSSFVEGRMSKVSRNVFLGLVRTEANLIWQSLERNVVALLEEQGKLEGKPAPARDGYGSSVSTGNNPARALTDIERELISGLIDEALEKFSADVIAKPDYALYSAGGRIIPRLTSPNYHHYVKPTLLGRLGARFFVPLPRREKPAEKAIEPDLHAGECWAMQGQEGQLAIRLARKIVITEVTIEHADPSVVLDMGSAAREIEVWGLRGSEDAAPTTPDSARPKVDTSSAASSEKQEQEKKEETPSGESVPSSKPGGWWREGAPWPGSTLLTTIEFEANTTLSNSIPAEKPKSRQTFSIPLSKQIVPSVGAVIRIKSNWGHPKLTCIYRVRIHGYEPTSPGQQ
ncbi:hypothetical protein BGX23_004958 [Mortierella sp. AD031]|nr:hypothetical protein BGX23_004958 [Mortierella sp. AD031]